MSSLVDPLVAKEGWYRTLFVTIPSALSLDFVSAFGKAVLWLWVFTLVGLGAVYELWRLTGRWSRSPSPSKRSRTSDQGEGLERRSTASAARRGWRDSYAWKVAVTFVATSLYLPLSKISMGALFWSSDFWVACGIFDLIVQRADTGCVSAAGLKSLQRYGRAFTAADWAARAVLRLDGLLLPNDYATTERSAAFQLGLDHPARERLHRRLLDAVPPVEAASCRATAATDSRFVD